MAASNYLEEAILNHIFRNSQFNMPSSIYIALTSDVPADDDTGTTIDEVQTPGQNGYSRQQIPNNTANNWSAPTQVSGSGQIHNTATVTFTANGTNWGWVSGVAICDAPTGGNVLYHGALVTPKQIDDGDSFTLGSGNIVISHS